MGDLDRVRDLVALGLDDFALYSGDDATARASILAGFHGDISVTANVAPEADGPHVRGRRSPVTPSPRPTIDADTRRACTARCSSSPTRSRSSGRWRRWG